MAEEGTFSHEESLPKLPLPELGSTFEQLKASLEPLYYADGYYQHPLDPEQIQSLSSTLSDFAKSEAAQKLQDKLKEFDTQNSCYLDKLHLDINNQTSSKEVADDVLPRNPFLILADDAVVDITQAERSAVLVHSALRFISALKNNKLPPDVNTKTGKYLSMEPYLNLFGTTRCPIFEEGEVENFDLDKPYTASDLDGEDTSDEFDDDYDFENEHEENVLARERANSNMSSLKEEDEEDDGPEPKKLVEETQKKILGPKGASKKKNNHSERPDSKGDCEDDSAMEFFKRHGITVKRNPESRHILVISKGQYYTVDVLDEQNRILYNSNQLTSIFDHILNDSEKSYTFKKSTALGSLTSHSFKNWKYARKRLQKRYPNELHLIDSALFVLVLDESSGNGSTIEKDDAEMHPGSVQSTSETCKRLFYGTSIIDNNGHQVGSCVSRWYDKLQLIVTRDVKAAVIWDSFTCDGSVVLRLTSETYTESILRLARAINAGDPRFSLWPSVLDAVCDKEIAKTAGDIKSGEISPELLVNKIDWSFSNILNTHVHLSETKLADLISKHNIVRSSVSLGRRSAQRLGINPDSMIQVALQVAFYALYGKMVYGYEPISTRSFKNSRSSFINIQNKELLELCQLFISTSMDGVGKLDKFIQTCQKHTETVRLAKQGKGFEKHFSALKYIYKFHSLFGIDLSEEDKEIAAAVFDNDAIAPFSQPELIIANCGNSATTTFGITPAVPHGFGIGYIIKDDQCDLTVTSQFRQGSRLLFMLNWVLNEIRNNWKLARATSQTRTGVKISPLVDRLYEMDNAMNAKNRSSSSVNMNSAYGLFDLEAHVDSRSVSKSPSVKNLSAKFSEMTPMNPLISTHSSLALSVPTETEKLNTGHQILQFQPKIISDEAEEEELMLSALEAKKRNVIDSKFEIDFDRSRVGRKVATFD
ncbi:Uncharacterized protein RNJ44_01895 [Nakaseomyces bracarensis]|uniref:Choline/carnitine acyltransferase domain-containing protein n=1 Tax=Nakaseomyces bracarensis TaxID=273131 RepID=A0ABR4NP42_9SACH